ncbi:reverse transcriptase domain-containing protein [Tanacetum coccineum]
MTSEATRSKRNNETRINKKNLQFEQDGAPEKAHDDDKFLLQAFNGAKIKFKDDEPWYADFVNYIGRKGSKPSNEILAHCHSGPTGGHHSANITAKKVYESIFYWPSVCKDNNELENPDLGTFTEEEITDEFPNEHLMILKAELNNDEPWYDDYVNYIVGKIVPQNWTPEKEEDFSLKLRIIFRTNHMHSSCARTIASITGRKVYESGFYWPSIKKDAKDYVMRCNACQILGNISSRSEMPQNNIQVCDVFDIMEG